LQSRKKYLKFPLQHFAAHSFLETVNSTLKNKYLYSALSSNSSAADVSLEEWI
jgi:hypothetical protein